MNQRLENGNWVEIVCFAPKEKVGCSYCGVNKRTTKMLKMYWVKQEISEDETQEKSEE